MSNSTALCATTDVRCADHHAKPCTATVLPGDPLRVQLIALPPAGGQVQWTMMASDGMHLVTQECCVTVSRDVLAMAWHAAAAVGRHVRHVQQAVYASCLSMRASFLR